MQTIALILVLMAAAWLFGVALLMAFAPTFAMGLLERMTDNLERSSWRLQFTEQGLRILAGAALPVRAPESKLPVAFQVAGAALVLTSLVIVAAPIHWHGAYGAMLMKRLTAMRLRLLSPIPAAAGAVLVYAAL